MSTWSTWSGVLGIELYGRTSPEFDDLKQQLSQRLGNPVTPQDWAKGIWKTLNCLCTSPCATSVPILQVINAVGIGGNKIILKPSTPKDQKILNNPNSAGAHFGQPNSLFFTPQDWDDPAQSPSLFLADETVLHELVHAGRFFSGLSNSTKLEQRGSQDYDTVDDFCAVVITNIYRSENRRPGLRNDHQEPTSLLRAPYTDPQQFASLWRDKLRQFQHEMGNMFTKIAAAQCQFNPFAVVQQEYLQSLRNPAG